MSVLDKMDARILRELKLNGRISNAELANRVGLSASACLRRVQELERSNTIKGYRAVLNQTQLGIGCVAYVTVGLSSHTKDAQLEFESAITLSEEVKECHNITGPFEYLLRVETTDLVSYKKFHTDVLGTSAHVASITTHVVMGSPKDDRA